MIECQKQSFTQKGLFVDVFVHQNQSKDLTISVQQQKNSILAVLNWLNDYQNIKQLSPIGKNPILKYDIQSQLFNKGTSEKSIRLDCEGKHPFCRYYIQQNQVKGKTNLAQIYIQDKLDKLMQLNQTEEQKKQSQKWRGRVQNCFIYFREYVKRVLVKQKCYSVAIRICLNE